MVPDHSGLWTTDKVGYDWRAVTDTWYRTMKRYEGEV